MSNPGDADATAITSRQHLADYLARGAKPAEQFRIGSEHEKFAFRLTDDTPPPYAPNGIGAVLEGLSRFGGRQITDQGKIIGLAQDCASIAVEPAGQLELSGGLKETLHETKAELETHFDQVRVV